VGKYFRAAGVRVRHLDRSSEARLRQFARPAAARLARRVITSGVPLLSESKVVALLIRNSALAHAFPDARQLLHFAPDFGRRPAHEINVLVLVAANMRAMQIKRDEAISGTQP